MENFFTGNIELGDWTADNISYINSIGSNLDFNTNQIIISYFDTIPDSEMFKILKDYEIKYNKTSEEAVNLWKSHEVGNPEFYNWVQIYKNLKM